MFCSVFGRRFSSGLEEAVSTVECEVQLSRGERSEVIAGNEVFRSDEQEKLKIRVRREVGWKRRIKSGRKR